MRKLLGVLSLFSFITLYAQNFAVSEIPAELRNDAYAVILNDQTTVDVNAIDKIVHTNDFAITVLEKAGDTYAQPYEFYDPNVNIKSLEAVFYDENGKEIKKFKSKDFLDQSFITGGQMYTDSRVKYLNYTPTKYPYTLHFKSVVQHRSTRLGRWFPIGKYNVSVMKSSFEINNPNGLKILSKELNLTEFGIAAQPSNQSVIHYEITNQKAFQEENLMPNPKFIFPSVEFSAVDFIIDGTKGSFSNWNELGKWYQSLLAQANDLNPAQKEFFRDMVKDAKSEKEKVNILYNHLQNKTRYIGVQLGIGGLKPFPASYVESKSYGDCKALTNYMQSMLDAVGIPSYYTVVKSGNREDFYTDFASIAQGDHVILYVPLKEEDVWLETTSQQTAFNYLGQFTDGRNALVINDEGGEIVRTKSYPSETNLEMTKGFGEILPDGKLHAEISITSSGLQYDWAYRINYEGSKEQRKILQDYFDNLPNLNIQNYSFENDRENAIFTKNVELESVQFAKIFGNNMAVNILPSGLSGNNLKKDNQRKFPFEVRSGYIDETDFEIKFPQGYQLNGEFENVSYESDFGSYHLSVQNKEGNILHVKRKLFVKDGQYPKEKYNDYVEFRRKISSFDNTKILLEKL